MTSLSQSIILVLVVATAVRIESCTYDEDCHGTFLHTHCSSSLSWRGVCKNGACSCEHTSMLRFCQTSSDCRQFPCPSSGLRPRCVNDMGHGSCQCA